MDLADRDERLDANLVFLRHARAHLACRTSVPQQFGSYVDRSRTRRPQVMRACRDHMTVRTDLHRGARHRREQVAAVRLAADGPLGMNICTETAVAEIR